MIKPGLERFDSPIVIINQVFENEDWGVVASYTSSQDALDAEGETILSEIGWHVGVTLPNLDDVDFNQVFSSPEAALEFGIEQIVNRRVTSPLSPPENAASNVYPFGHYDRIA
ncbi:MAG: hypothetical protein GY703_17325 [Gammaproteobacteria bacterium]|nr:hypothetical protein [Gammaproteobacteria bacterium]